MNEDIDELPPVELAVEPVATNLSKMPEIEIQQRLFGGVRVCNSTSKGIRGYNEYHKRHGQPWHCVSVKRLKEMLLSWGVDEDRAGKLAKEVGV